MKSTSRATKKVSPVLLDQSTSGKIPVSPIRKPKRESVKNLSAITKTFGKAFALDGKNVDFENLSEIVNLKVPLKLSKSARSQIERSRRFIEKKMSSGEAIYGVNTGFGSFSSVRISESQLQQLQVNLIRSHSCGIGQPFDPNQTRALMILRANTLARGHSGVRVQVVEKILEFLNHHVIPVVPSQGSVGASGDLAPLSHLALSLIGEGQVWDLKSPYPKFISTKRLLKSLRIQPLALQAKEGLSLINGCQVMTAIGLLDLKKYSDLLDLFDVAASLSLESLRGSRKAFHPLITRARPHAGEIKTAARLRTFLGRSSSIGDSHASCGRVQDAYSLRCIPAVHGAARNAMEYAKQILETEANSSTDNPLVFADENLIVSCGNFHGMPVAQALDLLAISATSLSSISEQRISKLVNTHMSDLPAFLTRNGGLQSGHMIVHVAAASLVSENKVLSHPASVDSIPTSADKEDHVSMGTIAARKFHQVIQNLENVLCMEFLSACQAIDFLRPLKTTTILEEVHALVRTEVPFASKDRIFSDDLKALKQVLPKILTLTKNKI